MPPELVCKTAEYLVYADAWNAASVNKHWTSSLLADPTLWVHVALKLTAAPSVWLLTLTTLVARSRGRPLTLEIVCDEAVHDVASPEYSALESVAHFIAGQMARIKSLSITGPTCQTPGWSTVLRERAPLLEVLRVHNNTFLDDTPRLPIGLFGGHAPRLRTLCLEQAYFPHDFELISGAALRGVTELAFHTSGALQYDDLPETLAEVMPNLRTLTCTTFDDYMHGPYVPLALELRVNAADGLAGFVAGFPHARSVTYSYVGMGRRGRLRTLGTAVRAQGRVETLEIAWAPLHANVFWLASSQPPRYLALSVNGTAVVVDITMDLLRAALTPQLVTHIASSVRTLAVVEEMWDLLSTVDMPELRDLSLFLRPREPEDWAQGLVGGGRHYKLQALRLVLDSGNVVAAVPAAVVGSIVRAIALPGTAPVVQLSGLTLAGDDRDLATVVERVACTGLPAKPVPESWSWELSEQKKIVIPARPQYRRHVHADQ